MAKFTLYDCKIRLAGNVLNEVPKSGVTAPEIECYRAVHGGADAVIGIVESGSVERSDKEERARLADIFANPDTAFGESLKKKQAMIVELFGHARLPLPKTIEDVASTIEPDDVDDEPGPVEPIKRAKVTQPAFAE